MWESKNGNALHSKSCRGNIQFDDTETLAVIYNTFDRKVRETLEIQKYDSHYTSGGMNTDKGQYVTTTFWIPFLKYMRNSKL